MKIYMLWSRDKDGFDMAAGVNLCDVRVEETLKIRIGKCQQMQECSQELLWINLEILQGKQKIYNRGKNRDIHETVIALWHSIKRRCLGPQQWKKVCGEFVI